ncbi:MAG: hypothetical protein ACP5N1_05220 [Candidatus Woesearchaeota archaeon]
MRLNGWTWLIAGLIVAMVSGYVYLFIPRNGSPNNAMALFFFIGIIFIVTGLLKILFLQKDDKLVMSAVNNNEKKILPNPVITARQNRVESQINQMIQQTTQKTIPNQSQINQANNQTTNIHAKTGTTHTNSLYNKYQYTGPVHNSKATHSTHPAHVAGHVSQPTIAQNHTLNSEHGLKCRSCSNVNISSANYCHKCGHRLK